MKSAVAMANQPTDLTFLTSGSSCRVRLLGIDPGLDPSEFLPLDRRQEGELVVAVVAEAEEEHEQVGHSFWLTKEFSPIPRTYLSVCQMGRLEFFSLHFFPTTLYRGAGIRTHVSKVAPDWDL